MGENYTAVDEFEWEDAPAAALSAALPVQLAGVRLDTALAKLFPQFSRNRLQVWLKSGHVLVDGRHPERSAKTIGGEKIELAVPPAADVAKPKAQRMALAIVFEDADLIVIDKPVGLIVHPGAGNPDGTLLNGLLAYAPALRNVPRAGIVHRLDKDTSGLLVVAKNLTAQARLAEQLAARTVKRGYLAVVHGDPPTRGTIDEPVGRDPRVRTRMAVIVGGRQARTIYKVLERFGKGALPGFALLECRLETGRTHQIRVHLQHIKCPIAGDAVYRRGAKPVEMRGVAFKRQALHAAELELIHPRSGKIMHWSAPLPADMKKLLANLRHGD
ncbi:MAG: RluA family pseudouridine synthase [Betaproteobacteria bacterium]|nr:RluA family pseudouridine synthase [Betaproteobacteria bacterium]